MSFKTTGEDPVCSSKKLAEFKIQNSCSHIDDIQCSIVTFGAYRRRFPCEVKHKLHAHHIYVLIVLLNARLHHIETA